MYIQNMVIQLKLRQYVEYFDCYLKEISLRILLDIAFFLFYYTIHD